MFRLNVDIKLGCDYRFQKFMLMVGDRVKAKGYLWELWALAQVHWYPNRELIPYSAWEAAGLPDALVECNLVEKRENGYYARGSEEYFAWKFQCGEAGKRSAESRKKKYGTSQPGALKMSNGVRTASNEVEDTITITNTNNPPPPTPPPSLTTKKENCRLRFKEFLKKAYSPLPVDSFVLARLDELVSFYTDDFNNFQRELNNIYKRSPDDPERRCTYITVCLKRNMGYLPKHSQSQTKGKMQ